MNTQVLDLLINLSMANPQVAEAVQQITNTMENDMSKQPQSFEAFMAAVLGQEFNNLQQQAEASDAPVADDIELNVNYVDSPQGPAISHVDVVLGPNVDVQTALNRLATDMVKALNQMDPLHDALAQQLADKEEEIAVMQQIVEQKRELTNQLITKLEAKDQEIADLLEQLQVTDYYGKPLAEYDEVTVVGVSSIKATVMEIESKDRIYVAVNGMRLPAHPKELILQETGDAQEEHY